MKRWASFAGVVLLAVAAVMLVQHERMKAEFSPAPIFHFVADTEQELMRVPSTLVRVSDDEEIDIGNRMAASEIASFGADPPESATVTTYLNQVGSEVAAHARRRLPYKVHYIPDDHFINAFALPGGHVFVGKGLLNIMQTEDELANILGHEVEHIDLRHCIDRVQIEAQLQQVPLGSIAALPVQVLEAGYTKQQELDADRDGTILAVAAGYSPQGAIQMFRKFQQLDDAVEGRRPSHEPGAEDLPVDIANVVVVQSVQEYFRSHPPPADRIYQIERLIGSEHWPPNPPQKPLQVHLSGLK